MKKTSIWILIFIIFVLSMLCGYYIAKNIKLNRMISSKENNIENQVEISEEEIRKLEEAKVVNSKEEKIGANTEVTLKTIYSVCGHAEKNKEEQSKVINMNKEELEKAYTGWNIVDFSEDEVKLEKEIEGMCGEHYVVTEENGLVVVYRKKVDIKTGNIGKEAVLTTDISVEYLPQEDLEHIRSGEEIYGKEELNKFLEDYE